MRARNSKPDFFKDERLAECSFPARLLYKGLEHLADRKGRLVYRPKRWRAEIFPYDTIDVEPLSEELLLNDCIKKYEADGTTYVWIPDFLVNQKPHPNEPKSTIAPHPDDQDHTQSVPTNEDLPTMDKSTSNLGKKRCAPKKEALGLTYDIMTSDILTSEEKKEENILHEAPPKKTADFYRTKKGGKLTGQKLTWFLRIYKAFNYPKGKAEAADAVWEIPDINEELVVIIERAAEAEAATRQHAMAQGKTPKMLQGWISGRRWEDEVATLENDFDQDLAAMRAAAEKRGLQ